MAVLNAQNLCFLDFELGGGAGRRGAGFRLAGVFSGFVVFGVFVGAA